MEDNTLFLSGALKSVHDSSETRNQMSGQETSGNSFQPATQQEKISIPNQMAENDDATYNHNNGHEGDQNYTVSLYSKAEDLRYSRTPYVPDVEGKIVCNQIPAFGYAITHIGGRSENQDSFYCKEIGDKGVLAIVCDGMGGGPGGRTASTRSIHIISKYIEDKLFEENGESTENILDKSLIFANLDLRHYQSIYPEYQGMGSTCVLLFLTRDRAHVRWVGDSRIYQVRNGSKIYRTNDHSRVFDLMASKAIKTLEDARKSSLSNQITSSLGFKNEIPKIGKDELAYKKGDRFLLCSDGIHGVIPEEMLIEKVGQPLLGKNRSNEEIGVSFIAKEMADSINNLGINNGNKHDNLTLILLITKEESQWQVSWVNKLNKIIGTLRLKLKK